MRWHELSLYQRVNTVLIIEGGCSKKLQERFNKLGVCLSHKMKGNLLNLIGSHYMEKAIDLVKNNTTLRGSDDNWDLKVLVETRKGVDNKDYHLFVTNLIANRIPFDHLPNNQPIGDIRYMDRKKFAVNMAEWECYRQTTKVLIGRIVVEFFPKFKFLKKVIPDHIDNRFSDKMSQKSTIISMPIIDANEARYADCVEILRTYEKWIAEIYQKAGKLTDMPIIDNTPLPKK